MVRADSPPGVGRRCRGREQAARDGQEAHVKIMTEFVPPKAGEPGEPRRHRQACLYDLISCTQL
ncbi:hypothetical protein SBA6_710032 [Candidatus Sulfopaludibacter sp. SbA6]|nr:hypothetical protein SBA6_710032 [Candidatus Sulfopaludibacter sp. SbA6]